MFSRKAAPIPTLALALAGLAANTLAQSSARAEALLLVDAGTGNVLFAQNATQPWYPASTTKIMTVYATLHAVKEGRLSLDTLLTVSKTAAAQAPVKMGFPPGTTLTVDNAIKMLLVKSANDLAVVLAEGVAGSVEEFAQLMNEHAQRLGMVQSHFVNPNGLPDEGQIVSARDMAILARAAIREFPEYDYYWHLPGIRLGKMVQRNYNTLIGRYPGADGMKTGFICASGFNLVATASRDGKRLIAVVLGAPSSSVRAIQAAELLEKGFTSNPLSWLIPSVGKVENLQPVNVDPPDLHEQMCGKHRRRAAAEDEDDSEAVAKLGPNSPFADFISSLRAPNANQNLLREFEFGEPVVVFTGTSPKKPAVSKTAAVHSKPASKGGDSTVEKPAGKAATAKRHPASSDPWSGLSPASLADSPPPELAASTTKGANKPAAAKPKPSKTAAAPDSSNPAKPPQKSAGKAAAGKSKGPPFGKPGQDAPHQAAQDPDKK
jgi:D-alanyl-D-alanine carboxypeptidase